MPCLFGHSKVIPGEHRTLLSYMSWFFFFCSRPMKTGTAGPHSGCCGLGLRNHVLQKLSQSKSMECVILTPSHKKKSRTAKHRCVVFPARRRRETDVTLDNFDTWGLFASKFASRHLPASVLPVSLLELRDRKQHLNVFFSRQIRLALIEWLGVSLQQVWSAMRPQYSKRFSARNSFRDSDTQTNWRKQVNNQSLEAASLLMCRVYEFLKWTAGGGGDKQVNCASIWGLYQKFHCLEIPYPSYRRMAILGFAYVLRRNDASSDK